MFTVSPLVVLQWISLVSFRCNNYGDKPTNFTSHPQHNIYIITQTEVVTLDLFRERAAKILSGGKTPAGHFNYIEPGKIFSTTQDYFLRRSLSYQKKSKLPKHDKTTDQDFKTAILSHIEIRILPPHSDFSVKHFAAPTPTLVKNWARKRAHFPTLPSHTRINFFVRRDGISSHAGAADVRRHKASETVNRNQRKVMESVSWPWKRFLLMVWGFSA